MEKTGLKPIDETDEELVELALNGGYERATNIIYAKYAAVIGSYLSHYIKDDFELEDVVQETFIKAFHQLDKFDPGKSRSLPDSQDSMRSWLFEIAKNTSLDHRDKNERKLPSASQLGSDSSADEHEGNGDVSAMSPEDELIISQRKERIEKAINGLSDLYRDVAKMCLIDYLGYKEIADKLDIPLNTVKTRIRRARDLITKIMNSEEE